MSKVHVRINGSDIELETSSTVEQMLQERNVTGAMFVVEKNLEIVPKEKYAETEVNAGDSFEIVGFFGGG